MILELESSQVATLVKKTRLAIVIDLARTLEMEGLMSIDIEEIMSQYFKGLQISDESEIIDIAHNYEEDEELVTLI